MKELNLIQELDTMVELEALKEAKRRRQKLTTTGNSDVQKDRNYVAKNMKLAGRAGVQKAKKGKGSYSRQKSKKID